MKKLLCTLLVLASLMSLCTFTAISAYTPEVGDGYISFDFNVVSGGIVNGLKTAKVERNVEFEGRTAVKFTPTPTLDTTAANYTLDCYTLGNYSEKIDLPRYKYIGITYYYDTDTPTHDGKMYINIINPSVGKDADSFHSIKTNTWDEAYFSISDMALPESDSAVYLRQIHFQPFKGKVPKNLSENDVLYVEKYTFYEYNPDENSLISVNFIKNTPEAVGDEIHMSHRRGESFTVPENPFNYPNAELECWENTVTGERVYPGEVYECLGYDMDFLAIWRLSYVVPDHLVFPYPDYSNGTVNGAKTATHTKTQFDGKRVVKIVPNPSFEQNKPLTMDMYTFNKHKHKIDLTQYNYLTVEYFYKSENPTKKPMRAEILTNKSGLSARFNMNASTNLVSGKWATAFFDFSNIESVFLEDAWPYTLFQIHFLPYGYQNVQSLSETDEMYISYFIFSKEIPDITERSAYMSGFEDGSFRPGKFMTRAEACASVARLVENEKNIGGSSEFSDISENEWYSKYIGFLSEKGLLSEYTDEFLPDKPITSSELSRLCVKAYAYKNGNGTEGGDPILHGDNSPISRADAVTMINTIFGISTEAEMLTDGLTVLFTDVDFRHPGFAQIAQATVSHTESFRKWVYIYEEPLERLGEKANIPLNDGISVGNAKIAELDILEKERIEEIRSTPSMDLSHITGKIIYVSTSGDDSNDGLSENTPVKSAAKAKTLVKSGDAVLFKRGDMWREKFVTVKGVTYSAYGDANAPKPIFNGSPENGADPEKWTLVYENPETGALIWQYDQDDFLDVGTMIFDGGEGFAKKDNPSFYKDKYFLRGQEDLPENERTEYDYTVMLDENLKFFHAADSVLAYNIPNLSYATGPLYLRCDNGNPGKVFDSIEFNTKNNVIGAASDVTIDNLCVINGGSHGIGAGTVSNLKITNCEIGWIGGSLQQYRGNGSAVRFGNGIEVYGGCDGYTIENCYVYQCYDAGITHQYSSTSKGDCFENNVYYLNNVIVDCVYNIEYFLAAQETQKNIVRRGDNIVIEGNLLRRAGFGFGSVRPGIYNQRNIRSGTSRNEFTRFVIRNNILDRAVYELAQTYSSFEITAPDYEGNTYIQGVGNRLFHHGRGTVADTDINTPYSVKEILGDKTGVIYYTDYIPLYEYTYTPPRTVAVTDEERTNSEK